MNRAAPLPAAGLAAKLRSGELPLLEHLEAVLDRLEALEPEIQALLPEPGRRDRILAEGRALAALYPEPSGRPPLYGLLLGVKDLFNAEGFETRAGSRLPPELFAGPEAPAVAALKRAGAIVLGKTVSTEFAYFAPGPTRNPHDPSRTPGGSSSGSAAAIAAGFAHLALGTQTIGSIGRPAAFCGIAGLKPSYDRVSREGAVPFAASLDHVGLLAGDAAALALGASILLPAWSAPSCAAAATLSEAPTIAVPEGPYLEQASPEALTAFEEALRRLGEAGCRVIRLEAFEDIAAINERHNRIGAAEMARAHRAWYPRYKALYAEKTRELIERGLAIGDEELDRDRWGRYELRRRLDEALARAGAELWASPGALGPAPEGLASTGSPLMNLPWTHAGLPALVLPAGRSREALPLGLQLCARFGSDEALVGRSLGLEARLAE